MREKPSIRALFASAFVVGALATVSGCTGSGSSATSGSSSGPSAASSGAAGSGAWTVLLQKAAPANINMVGFLNATFGLAVGHTGDSSYTTDGGANWTSYKTLLRTRFGLDIVDENLAWDCGLDNPGFSTDGGKSWQATKSVLLTPTRDAVLFASFLDAKTGWAATAAGLNATSDGGQTWTNVELPSGLSNGIAAIRLRTATEGYLVDNGGTLWITADAGKTWTSQSLGLAAGASLVSSGVAMAAVHFFDGSKGMVIAKVATSTGNVIAAMHTADGGKTWTSENVPVDARLVDSVYLGPDGVTLTMIVGSDVKVLQYK